MSKPKRLWFLQLVVLAQLVCGLPRLARGLASLPNHAPRLEAGWWLVESLAILATSTLFILASARRLPRPQVVAPLVGLVWWVHGLTVGIRSLTQPPPPDLAPYLAKDVSRTSEILGMVLLQLFMLWLVGSLVWHRRTRAFLAAQAAPTRGVVSGSG